jgi:hypothetical protein
MTPALNLRNRIAAALPSGLRGVVRTEGVVWRPEAGNWNSKSLLSAERRAAAFKDNSAKDVTAFAMIYGLMTLVLA